MHRPFRILGVQQVAIGASEKASLRPLWLDCFGLTHIETFTSANENVVEDVLRIGDGATAVEVDLMQPLDPAAKPRVDRPALNHIGLWVDDLGSAVEWLQAQGVRFAPGGIRRGASGHDVCFIHPKSTDAKPISGEGVLIELVQAPNEVVEHFLGAGHIRSR